MLTVQEIGNMVKMNLQPIVFVINNAGYTIERVIHGARMSYNDIVPFNYEHMLPFFSKHIDVKTAPEMRYLLIFRPPVLDMPVDQARECFHRASTKAELEEILNKDSVKNPKTVQVVEIVMDIFDVPWRLSTQIATRGPEAVKESMCKPLHEAETPANSLALL